MTFLAGTAFLATVFLVVAFLADAAFFTTFLGAVAFFLVFATGVAFFFATAFFFDTAFFTAMMMCVSLKLARVNSKNIVYVQVIPAWIWSGFLPDVILLD